MKRTNRGIAKKDGSKKDELNNHNRIPLTSKSAKSDIYTDECTNAHTQAHAHTTAHALAHTHTRTHTRTRTHTHTHTHTHAVDAVPTRVRAFVLFCFGYCCRYVITGWVTGIV